MVLAVALLAIPATPAYDPWAWLVWGREVAHLQLDTLGGPAWKPLPVAITTLLSPFGEGAPTLWLVISRAAGLLTLVAVYRLATHFAGRVAGLVAAALLLLTPDADPRFARLILEGHSAPVTAALALWAVDRHLAGRPTAALLLGTALALDRPEAWPFLAVYAVWLWRRDPGQRALIAIALPLVPLLWFGGDWWGSGSPWHGAGGAQVVANESNRTLDALHRVAEVVVVPAWFAAAFAVVDARRRHENTLIVLAGGALAWCAIVVAMTTVFGYAALSRFFLPAAALLCVLAGIGVVRVWAAIPAGAARAWIIAALVIASIALSAPRVLGSGAVIAEVEARERIVSGLDVAVERAGGRRAVLSCGRVVVDGGGVPQLALAWKLDVALADVHRRIDGHDRVVLFARTERRANNLLARTDSPTEAVALARSADWQVFGRGCPERTAPGQLRNG